MNSEHKTCCAALKYAITEENPSIKINSLGYYNLDLMIMQYCPFCSESLCLIEEEDALEKALFSRTE